MKTIEELVAQVAKNAGVSKPTPKPVPKPAEILKPIPQEPVSVPKAHKCNCTYKKMTLDLAKKAARAAEIAAEKLGIKVVVAICDEGANLVLLHAMDDSYIASIKAAQDKAYTAVALKMPTHIALKESRGGALDGLTNGNGILLLGGGFPLEAKNKIYGGIGVSGGTKEQDTLIAATTREVLRVIAEKEV